MVCPFTGEQFSFSAPPKGAVSNKMTPNAWLTFGAAEIRSEVSRKTLGASENT